VSATVLTGAESVMIDVDTITRESVVIDGGRVIDGAAPEGASSVDVSGCVITPGW
jgi:imidazolonepropionase-like amidohydrolase